MIFVLSVMCIMFYLICFLVQMFTFLLLLVFDNPPCLATGDWRAQCLPCGGGYFPGVLRLGASHHSHAYGKPVLLLIALILAFRTE